MDLPVTNTKLQDRTTTHNCMEQEVEKQQHEMTILTTAVTKDTSSDSGSDWDFLDALDSTGMWTKIKEDDKITTITPTIRPNSDL